MNAIRTLVAGAALALLAAAPAAATYPGANGRIFYTAPGCGVASATSQGTGTRCIAASGRNPSVSRDGSRIVWSIGGENNLYVMNTDGSAHKRIVSSWAIEPFFSPDGGTIIYSDYSPDVNAVPSSGGGGTPLTDDGHSQNATFSPDGRQIAYVDHGINVMNADGSGKHVVLANEHVKNGQTTIDTDNGWPSWSPDGSKIVFARTTFTETINCTNPFAGCGQDPVTKTDDADIFVMNADGSDVRQLTNDPHALQFDPFWSPDGTKISYFLFPPGAGHDPDAGPEDEGFVYVMGADGSGQHQLMRGSNAYWSSVPDAAAAAPMVVSGIPHRRCVRKNFRLSVRVTELVDSDLVEAYLVVDGRVRSTDGNSPIKLRVPVRKLRRGKHRAKVLMTFESKTYKRRFSFRRC
jgi:Tol biopolymer transport system component